MSKIGMNMLASKGNVPDVRKVDIYFCKPGGLGKQKNLSFIMLVKTRKLHSRSCGRIVMLKMVPETPLQFGVAERLSRTFRAESTGLRAEAPKMLWADSVSSGSDEMDTAFGDTKRHQVIRKQDFHLRTQFWSQENDSIVAEHGLSSEITQSPGGSSDTSEGFENSESFKDSGRSDEEYSEDGASSKEGGFETPQVRRSTRESRAPVRYSPLANYLLLTENGEPESFSEALSSKESVQWKKAIIEEMVSLKKNQTCSLVILPAGKKASQSLWMFRVKEEQDGNKSWAGRKIRVQIEGNSVRTDSSTEAMILKFDSFIQKNKVDDMLVAGFDMAEFNKPKWQLPLVFEITDRCSKKADSWIEEPCSDVHQVGVEREVEVLRSFNWPPTELITEDGVLPERGYSQFDDVSSRYLVSKVS
ncbi:hypothetical protein Tco_0885013 [Tanacetum coccineum]